MTCTNIGNAIVCTSPYGRLKVGNRYVWVDYHSYCGPSFTWDAAGNEPYEPEDEHDPVWTEFDKWLKKYHAKQQRAAIKKAEGAV